MARGVKQTGIPAVPPQPTAEHFQFAQALKQGVERLTTVTDQQAADAAASRFWSEGHVHTIDPPASGQAIAPRPANGPLQRVINNAAHKLTCPTENCVITLLYLNGPSAGAITPQGFKFVSGTSAPPSNVTTSTYLFMARITVIEGIGWLSWNPLQ